MRKSVGISEITMREHQHARSTGIGISFWKFIDNRESPVRYQENAIEIYGTCVLFVTYLRVIGSRLNIHRHLKGLVVHTVGTDIELIDGISFFSTDGKRWTDLCDYSTTYSSHVYKSQVACIKAFTFLDEISSNITLNISNKGYNPVDIIANV